MNSASAPLILALTSGRRPLMVTGSSASLPILQAAKTRVGGPDSARTISATHQARTGMAIKTSANDESCSLGFQFSLVLRPAVLEQRISPDPYPDDVHGRRGQGTIPTAVHHKPGRPQNVHEVIDGRFRFESSRRSQRVGPN